MRGCTLIRSSSSRWAVTRTSSGSREARLRSTVAPSASVTVTLAVIGSNPSPSATTVYRPGATPVKVKRP